MADATTPVFITMDEITRLIEAFEDGTLSRTEWTHEAHLAVAAWYLSRYSECNATERVITGIQRYNHVHRIRTTPTGGYHETLTLFWLAMVQRCLAALEPSTPLSERIKAVLDTYGTREGLPFEYYTRDRIMSLRARQTWVEPDRRPLESNPGC